MFPYVHWQQGLVLCGQRGAGGAHVDNVHATIGLFHQPGPAGTEIADSSLDEGVAKSGKASPFLVDGIGQGACGLSAAVGLHAIPEKGVVPDLGGVVVNGTTGLLDDVFERHGLELGAFLQFVELVDISLVVLAVMVLERFLAVMRLQRIDRVGQRRQLVFHARAPLRIERVGCTDMYFLILAQGFCLMDSGVTVAKRPSENGWSRRRMQ